ncbi:MAG: outer membrane protein assembly factor BamD, partial [Nitrospirota bacterium]|nr:outer membrane protein assembly factor BamD [Nitrospirota bacterium]
MENRFEAIKSACAGLCALKRLRLVVIAFVSSFMIIGCASTLELRSMSARELYVHGMTAFRDADYNDAEKYFKGIMEEHPLDPLAVEAQLMLGDVYFLTEKYEDGAV